LASPLRTMSSVSGCIIPAKNLCSSSFNFWKTTPYKVVFGCTSCAQDEEKLASPSNCKIPSGVQLPPAAALRRSHTRAEGHHHFRAIHALVGVRSTFAVPHLLAQSSEHPNTFTSFRRPHASVFGCSARVARNAQSRPRIAPPWNRVARHPLAWSDERRPDRARDAPCSSLHSVRSFSCSAVIRLESGGKPALRVHS
jgi:hypothetical protein